MKFSGLQLFVAENSPRAVSTDQLQLQQTVIATVAGKELTDNGENANGKQSPPHEASDLLEWYETCLIQTKRQATQISKTPFCFLDLYQFLF
jgi:hypothetical protein